MSWNAVKVPIFVGIGLAAPGLVVLGLKNIPPDLVVFRATQVSHPQVFAPSEPLKFFKREPVAFDPFRAMLPKEVSRHPSAPQVKKVAPQQVLQPLKQAPRAEIKQQPSPASDGPVADPKLEGVVGGENPVAVIKIGEESLFVRVGQNLGNGFHVLSITESEVRLKQGSRELILKIGIR
ncbi:MAG: hypothetical protein ACAH95_05115 [Fimbriimonas sp.]